MLDYIKAGACKHVNLIVLLVALLSGMVALRIPAQSPFQPPALA